MLLAVWYQMTQLYLALSAVDPKFVFVLLCSCFIIYTLLIDLLRQKRDSDVRDPSSFFSLDQITSKNRLYLIELFFVGSVCILFAAFAIEGGPLLLASNHLLLALAEPIAPKEIAGQLTYFFQAVPAWLQPLFVLTVFLIIFKTKLRITFFKYRDILLGIAGFYSLINEISMDAAKDILDKHKGNYDGVVSYLSTIHSELPLPEQFIDLKGEKRLAYQLIWLNLRAIKDNGVAESFRSFRAKHGLNASEDEEASPSPSQLSSAAVIFCVLIGFYVIVAPFFHDNMENWGFHWIQNDAAGWASLIRTVLGYTLSFIFPLMFAIEVYPTRRRAFGKKETPRTTIAVIAASQCMLSFLVSELFNLIDLAIAYSDRNQSYNFWEARIHVGAFCYSVAPVCAFYILIKFRKLYSSFLLGVLVSAGAAFAFFISDFIYECCMRRFDMYFVHQSLFGFYVAAAFLFACTVTGQRPFRREVSPR